MAEKKTKKSAAAARAVTTARTQIVRQLKKQGKYTDELRWQADLASRLKLHIELLEKQMSKRSYSPVVEETSREGNVRLVKNPLEDLYLDYMAQYQRALKALGMNTDSKERKGEGVDPLKDFTEQFKEEASLQ